MLKRALLSIMGNKGKYLLLFMLVFVLGVFISGAISVSLAVQRTEENLLNRLPAVAVINGSQARSSLDFDVVRQIGELPYVQTFDFSVTSMMQSLELDMVEFENTSTEIGMSPRVGDGPLTFIVRGVNNLAMTDIQEGLIVLDEGRVFTEEEIQSGGAAIIPRGLADLNGIGIGSSMTLYSMVFDHFGQIDGTWRDWVFTYKPFELEVVGIFTMADGLFEENVQDDINHFEFMANQIYVSNVVTEASITFNHYGNQYYNDDPWINARSAADRIYRVPFFVLNSPRDLRAFSESASTFLADGWIVQSTMSSLDLIMASLDNFTWIAHYILVVAMGAAIIILSLLIMLFLKDRKHEMGVYLALGEKRGKVLSQLLLEVLTISFLASASSLIIGNQLADAFSEQMIRNDLLQRQEEDTTFRFTPWELAGFDPGLTDEDVLANYTVTLDSNKIALFFGVTLLAIIASATLPTIYLYKLNPKELLM